ncbi:hypothetical protein TRIUR3_10107 [Triticum urartu]|uniref:Uncharacterized protein n=1 Tax=Triticum urartu TaxID=4572 RepID=M7YPE1_TRIUA|nr:hypothetical protein TRIUR3_10107 [Triticum urartu]
MEVATVFLETSLGTRLAVSFPASATTVADLKRRVGDEHAAAFPHIGHIAVQSIKVKQGGSLYLLTDSMAVRDAFRGVTGAWHLQLQVHALPRPHSALHVASTCKHSSQPCVPACHQHQHDSPSRTFAAFGLRRKEPCSSIGIPGNNMCNAANTKQDAPCVEQLNHVGDPCSQMQLEEKEPWTDSVCKGGGSSHWNDPIEWTDAEQRAWEMALEKRRRPRIAVRKMPNSRAAKLYGYR